MVKASVCGTDIRGFNSHHSPHFLLLLKSVIASNGGFKLYSTFEPFKYKLGHTNFIILRFCSLSELSNKLYDLEAKSSKYCRVIEKFKSASAKVVILFPILCCSALNSLAFLSYSSFVMLQSNFKQDIEFSLKFLICCMQGFNRSIVKILFSFKTRFYSLLYFD